MKFMEISEGNFQNLQFRIVASLFFKLRRSLKNWEISEGNFPQIQRGNQIYH